MVVSTAELVLDAGARTAEGPVWDTVSGLLRWVDIPAGEVHALDVSSGEDTQFTIDGPATAVLLRASGGLVLAVRDGFVTCAADGRDCTRLATVPVPDGGRMNDAACDPAGRILGGSMHPRARNLAALFQFDERGSVRTLLEGVGLSNGLDWSPDGRTLYYADTPTGRVDAFDYDPASGALAHRREFVHLERGRPDGLCVDTDGCVWVALWEGGGVQRFSPRGHLDGTVELPVSRVTSCAFGGAGLDTLYVTTARGNEADRERYAGGIFAISGPAPGQSPRSWAG
jgi:sugar lactone lactonase YvrE